MWFTPTHKRIERTNVQLTQSMVEDARWRGIKPRRLRSSQKQSINRLRVHEMQLKRRHKK